MTIAVPQPRPRWELVTLLFFFGFYLNLPVIATRFHGVPQPAASGFALLLLVPVAAFLLVRRQPLVRTAALPLMVAYFLALLLSAALAPRPGSAESLVVFLTEGLLLYLLVSNSVRSAEGLRRVVWTLVLAGAVMGGLSIYQEWTQSYENSLGGLAQVNASSFSVGEGLEGARPRPRLAGPIGETNRYAQILLVLLPLALALARGEPSRLRRALAAGSAVLALAGIVLTFSRGAAVALAAVLAIMLLTGFVRLRHAVALALALLVLAGTVAPDYLARIRSLGGVAEAVDDGSGTADGAVRGRLAENLGAWSAFVDHPIVGVGPGQYAAQYSREYGNETGFRFLETERRAHNLYLEIAADTGLIGFGVFMAMVSITCAQLWRLSRFLSLRRPEHANLASALLFGLVAYLASGMFLHLAYARYYWLLLGLANAGIWILTREASRSVDAGKARAA